eukprot:scaffold223920_cov15-Tisochrysis_lutea.AAC.2
MSAFAGIFPWMSEYKADELPDFPAIREALFAAGEAARALGQRLTFHPSGCGSIRSTGCNICALYGHLPCDMSFALDGL